MSSTNPKHILLVSTPLYGHAIPLLQLGLKLSHFHRITFTAFDPQFVDKLRNELKDSEFGKYGPIEFLDVPDISAEAVEKNPDMIDASPQGLRGLFERIYPSMREFFLNLLPTTDSGKERKNQHNFDAVIVENFLGGPACVLKERGIPYYLFNTARAWLVQCLLTIDMEEPEDFSVSRKTSPFATRLRGGRIYDPNLDFSRDILLENSRTMQLAEGIVFNSLREAEAETLAEILAAFPAMKKLNTFFVSPLVLAPVKVGGKTEDGDLIVKWLNRQENGTVVNVSFGSIAIPAAEQIAEIGKALLLMKKPFTWSLSATNYGYLPEELQKGIKSQSDDSNRLFLILPWVPQKAILSHPATSVFVSHCGWNSTMETLTCGVPIVAWPMFADQKMNAEWLEKEGAGKMLHGTGRIPERLIPAEEIREVIEQVAEVGSSYRSAAKEWQTKIRVALGPGGSSYEEFLELSQF